MTDLKRRSLVAALGAAPLAVPLLAHAQDRPKTERSSNRSRRGNGSGDDIFRILC